MKEVKCKQCGKGLEFYRHDTHLLHNGVLLCPDCLTEMKNKKPIITFDEEAFNQIKKMFGLKNLKCMYCNKRITKKNIGGFINTKEVFCRNNFCLMGYIYENKGG